MSEQHLFCFAAKGLQSYIMRGGKLRDMVGATSLIDKLSSETELAELIRSKFGVAREFTVRQAAAGGARITFADKDDAVNVAQLWPLYCQAWAPDLEVVQDLRSFEPGGYAKAIELAAQALEQARNFPAPRLPEATPFAIRAARTGEPAVVIDTDAADELIDRATQRKRQERKPPSLRNQGEETPIGQHLELQKRYATLATDLARANIPQVTIAAPEEFGDIAGSERAYLAIIHADGNGLGKAFLAIGQKLASQTGADDAKVQQFLKALSADVVAAGTEAAAKTALDQVDARILEDFKTDQKSKERSYPLVPLVLAGDDLTVVCRADLAFSFIRTFLTSFEGHMKAKLEKLRNDYKDIVPLLGDALPSRFSAGAGIVFCSSHYPFSLGYELCEDLAKNAKTMAKTAAAKGAVPASAVSFVRITGASAPTSFDDLKKGILKSSDGKITLTCCPYYVGGGGRQLDHLVALVDAMRPTIDEHGDKRGGLSTGSLRNLLGLQRTDITAVPDALSRMIEVAGESAAKDLAEAWKKLTSEGLGNLALSDRTSPLHDAITLLALGVTPDSKGAISAPTTP
jgi:hypothetical protein